MRWLWTVLSLICVAALLALPRPGSAAEAVVYSVYKGVDLGEGFDPPQRDYYVNLGTQHGVREGSVLDVYRKLATYDLQTQKLFRDMVLPVGKLKVIHAEGQASIARLEGLVPSATGPSLSPRAVIVGDVVRPAR